MGGFCSGPTPSQKQDIDTGKFSSSQAPKNSALDDLQMDLGMKPKNQVYFRDLEDRQNRAKNAMNNLGKDIFGRPASEDRPAATPEPVVETTTPVDTTAEEIIETIPDPTQITNMEPLADLEKLDEDIKKNPDQAGSGEGLDAPTEPDVGAGTTTALGGEEEAAKLEEVAEGDAELAVADTIKKSRRSTVQTTPQGLLSSAPTRTRRSLMGKMIA